MATQLRPLIKVDDRAGSDSLIVPLRALGLDVKSTRLSYGDVSFDGQGPRGPVLIGVEYKSVRDLLASMRNGRLPGHQLPGMAREYDIYYLLVEGLVRCGNDNILETRWRESWVPVRNSRSSPPFLWSEFDGYLTSLESKAAVRIRKTANITQSAAQIESLANWWIKPWDEHKSVGHTIWYTPPERVGAAAFDEPSIVRKVAALLPGIGWEKSRAVEMKFRSVLDMVAAEPRDWEQIPGIGPTLAHKAVDSLRLTSEELRLMRKEEQR